MPDETDDETCPHCGKRLSDLYDYFPRGDDKINTECGWCEKPIAITQSTYRDYVIEKAK